MAENQDRNESLRRLWNIPIRQGQQNVNEQGIEDGALIGGWVPTSHDFTTALQRYLEYRLDQNAHNISFRNWLINQPYNNEFWYVANQNEFALNDQDIDFIQSLFNSLNDAVLRYTVFNFFNIYKNQVINSLNDDKWKGFPKYLMDTYLTGKLAEELNDNQAKKNVLIDLHYAGTDNAAQAILTVGSSFGRHFKFLDENDNPTQLFHDYFS